ncbi:MAG TPA: acyl-CoA thioesterase domain-containing protein [Acidimicrobiales bacterium]|nr:acyl-CoA thioesterase domain-containing protein [Acidimicrobiales bacterium]
MVTIEALLDALTLERTGPDRYRAPNAATGHGVVFGGQLLAQSIVAGLAGHGGKSVKTFHTVFARGASPDAPVEIAVDPMHAGRSFASSAVTISQGDRLCARSIVLLSADEPDVIRHADPMPEVAGPDECKAMGESSGSWEVRVVGDVDISDPEAVGPAELDVWTRWVGAPDDPGLHQALVAFATDGFLIGTAMRPHPGVGQAQAHVTLATGVISHTLTFHEPCPAGEWLLLSHRSPYAGRGRSYGRADIFRCGGPLVASFVQDAMIRSMS